MRPLRPQCWLPAEPAPDGTDNTPVRRSGFRRDAEKTEDGGPYVALTHVTKVNEDAVLAR